jgi:hypothetical protein
MVCGLNWAMPNSTSEFEPRQSAPRFCSFCGRPVVVSDASFCKECGGALGRGFIFRQDVTWNPWIAAAMSVVPGLGQFYKGQRWQALAWFLGVAVAYSAYPLGLLLHLLCVANAALAGAVDFPAWRFRALSSPSGGRPGPR